MSEKQPVSLIMPRETVEAVLNYLMGRPLGEVQKLFTLVTTTMKPVEAVEPTETPINE